MVLRLAPISKLALLATLISSLAVQSRWPSTLRTRKVAFSLTPELWPRAQFWRLISSQWACCSTQELLLTLVFIAYWAEFERRFGSRKFASAILVLMGISLTFQAVFLWIFRTIKYTASGPYALVFGLFSYFISDIPAWTRYRLFGIPLSFKSGFYIIALQLAFANVPGSIIASICGLAAGILFRAPCMPFRKFRLPKFLFSWLEKAKSNSLQTAHEMSRIPRLNEDAVKELKSMGFSEQDARSALSKAGNDLTRATHFLLDSDTHSHD